MKDHSRKGDIAMKPSVTPTDATATRNSGLRAKIKSKILTKLAVRKNVQLGPNFHVGPGSVVWAPKALRIGRDVYVGKNATLEVDGEIGDCVLIANSVGLVGRRDHDQSQVGVAIRHARWVGDHPETLSERTIIGSDVWIGYGAVVLSGVTVGDSSVIAAGSIVTADVPPNSVVAGNPARVVRQRFSDSSFREHWHRLQLAGVRRLVDQEQLEK